MSSEPYIHLEEATDEGDGEWFAYSSMRLVACPGTDSESKPSDRARRSRLSDQIDFLNSLYEPSDSRLFSLRFISRPDAKSLVGGKVELAMIMKTIARTRDEAKRLAREGHDELIGLLGGFLYEYDWHSICDEQQFLQVFKPFGDENLCVAEICRREQFFSLGTLLSRPTLLPDDICGKEEIAEKEIYVAHRFLPRESDLSRLLRVMLIYPEPLLLQVLISPTKLRDEEETLLAEEVDKCEAYLSGSPGSGVIGKAKNVHQRRARMLCDFLNDQLLRLQDAPFLMQVSVASTKPIKRGLLEAIGVEFTLPVGGESGSGVGSFMGGYDVRFPQTEEDMICAVEGMSSLSFKKWGEHLAPETAWRLRYLFDAWEACAAFRLPQVSRDGILGFDVRISRKLPVPKEAVELCRKEDPDKLTALGRSRYLGFVQEVFIHEKDRGQHVYIIGQTGTGKTTLMKRMIISDIEKGKGLAVIDPHGDLFEEIVCRIPEERIKDVIIINPADMEWPVGMNVLEYKTAEERHFIVREMRSIIERLLYDQYSYAAAEYTGPFFYQLMQNVMLLVMSNPDEPGTLLDFYQVFQDGDYWKRWEPYVEQDPKLERFAKEVLGKGWSPMSRTDKQHITIGEYISSKFEDFVFDPRLCLIFGQRRSTIDFESVMNEGKILLVNLAKGMISEANSRFLGMLIMAKIQAAAMKRVNMAADQRRPFYLYADEFQSIATENFVVLLSESRKFGVNLILANQFIKQIKDMRIQEAIFGNVGNLIVFRVGAEDAAMLQPHFLPYYDSQDLTMLPNWNACIKMTVRGQIVRPFDFMTALPEGDIDESRGIEVKKLSRKRYGRKKDDVEAEMLGLQSEKQ